MRQGKFLAVFFLLAILSGCETGPAEKGTGSASADVEFTGKSHADALLKRDALRTIRMIVKAKGCASIDHVDSGVLSYEPMNGTQGHIWGREGWMVTGCSKPFPFYVEFTEDGSGGSFFAVSMK